MAIAKMTQNDLLPILSVTLTDADGDLFDLTGSTVTLKVKDNDGTLKIDTAGTPDPDQVTNKGQYTYTWVSGDTDTSGRFQMQHQVTTGGKSQTFPTGAPDWLIIYGDLDPS